MRVALSLCFSFFSGTLFAVSIGSMWSNSENLTRLSCPAQFSSDNSDIMGFAESYYSRDSSGNTSSYNKYGRHALKLQPGQTATLEFSFATWSGGTAFNYCIAAYNDSYWGYSDQYTAGDLELLRNKGTAQFWQTTPITPLAWSKIDPSEAYVSALVSKTRPLKLKVVCSGGWDDGDYKRYSYDIYVNGTKAKTLSGATSANSDTARLLGRCGIVLLTNTDGGTGNHHYSISYGIGGWLRWTADEPPETDDAVLEISGDDTVRKGSTKAYSCKIVHSDGTTEKPSNQGLDNVAWWGLDDEGKNYASIGLLDGKLTVFDNVVGIKTITIETSFKNMSRTKTVTIIGAPEATTTLSEALDNQALTFTTGGSSQWVGQSLTTYDGTDAAQSGFLEGGQTNWMQTSVSGPGTISFWWCADSQVDDYLKFLVDGKVKASTSGPDNGWTQKSFEITGEGEHVLQWRYQKDMYWDRGLDAGFVDQIVWTPLDNQATLPDLFPCFLLDSDWPTLVALSASADEPYSSTLVFKTSDTLYVGWNVGVSGASVTDRFYTRILVDGEQLASWSTDSISVGSAVGITGHPLGSFAAGEHVLVLDADHTESIAESDESNNTHAITFTVVADEDEEPSAVSVVFDAQGGKLSNGAATRIVEATPGNLWGKLPMPSMSGQVFDGWFTDARGSTMITASSAVPSAGATYYAHWTPRLGLAAASEWGGAFETDSWCGQVVVSHDGNDALRSGIIYNNQSSYIRTTVIGAGTLSFWWAVSCEASGNDALSFLVDGVQKKYISGERDWANVVFDVSGSGEHTIEWRYTKNATVTKGEDFGWLDQISWTATPAETAFVFDANGGKFSNGASVKKTDATPGNLWGKMYMPAKDGQVFVGWYTAKEGGTLVTSSSTVPNAYATYYAHWTPRLGLAAASEWSREFTTDSWCGQGVVSYDGKDALRSGIVYDGQSSYLITRVPDSDTLTFWWKVSCEGGGNDALRLLVDGVQVKMISGDTDWTKVSVDITGSGTHVLKWNYTKNGSVTKGEDFGWIDRMSWVGR